ncbi:MOSC domain-containing protein [Nafulsella turpanensis]|uniref:MOSC domain-containing protein n=1 Tax=Nafulsella turpanensis TaxID=1265690 RepID=UPI00034C7CA6|nr:MOSC N-terminal beta barrel domain-containing protein [Nafulsella turpanensis]
MHNSSLQLSEIWIYPIKSLAGIQLEEARLCERGLQWDRRWMLLDENGQFMTQRQMASMALLDVSLQSQHLEVRHRTKNLPPLNIPLQVDPLSAQIQAPIWDDTSKALFAGQESSEWFSEALEQRCQLVFMPEDAERLTRGKISGRVQKVSFADEYPILLIGQSSLDELNRRLEEPVSMNRFRPNLVFSGGKPFEEDGWHAFAIGETRFWAEKPCARCVVTTIDQLTGEKVNKEPLATLAQFRKWNQKLLFGQNLLFEGEGLLRVGDRIQVKSHKESPLPL